jgi:hypothetical protein
MIQISYFLSITGFEILLQKFQGCSNFQYFYSLCLYYHEGNYISLEQTPEIFNNGI